MAAIGERTHRWFVLFLYFTIQVSLYYTNGYFKVLLYLFKIRAKEFNFYSISEYLKTFLLVSLYDNTILFLCFIWLTIIFLVLLLFFFQKIYEISNNETAIEAAKLSYKRRNGQNCKNYYDEGFIKNWKRVIFPPVVEEHEPFKLEKDENGRYLVEFYYIDNSDYEHEYETNEEEEKDKDDEERKKK